MTPAERILRDHLRANRLQGLHFRRQQIIAGFIVDFYCHSAALVIELDGDIHRRQPDYDAERDRVLATRGLRILRIPNDGVHHDFPAILARIAATCGRLIT
jgi:very-short-patch-repair endonuclease